MWSSSTRELFVKLYGHLKRKIKDHDIQARLHSNGKKLLCFSWHWGQMLLKLTDFKLYKPTSNTWFMFSKHAYFLKKGFKCASNLYQEHQRFRTCHYLHSTLNLWRTPHQWVMWTGYPGRGGVWKRRYCCISLRSRALGAKFGMFQPLQLNMSLESPNIMTCFIWLGDWITNLSPQYKVKNSFSSKFIAMAGYKKSATARGCKHAVKYKSNQNGLSSLLPDHKS